MPAPPSPSFRLNVDSALRSDKENMAASPVLRDLLSPIKLAAGLSPSGRSPLGNRSPMASLLSPQKSPKAGGLSPSGRSPLGSIRNQNNINKPADKLDMFRADKPMTSPIKISVIKAEPEKPVNKAPASTEHQPYSMQEDPMMPDARKALDFGGVSQPDAGLARAMDLELSGQSIASPTPTKPTRPAQLTPAPATASPAPARPPVACTPTSKGSVESRWLKQAAVAPATPATPATPTTPATPQTGTPKRKTTGTLETLWSQRGTPNKKPIADLWAERTPGKHEPEPVLRSTPRELQRLEIVPPPAPAKKEKMELVSPSKFRVRGLAYEELPESGRVVSKLVAVPLDARTECSEVSELSDLTELDDDETEEVAEVVPGMSTPAKGMVRPPAIAMPPSLLSPKAKPFYPRSQSLTREPSTPLSPHAKPFYPPTPRARSMTPTSSRIRPEGASTPLSPHAKPFYPRESASTPLSPYAKPFFPRRASHQMSGSVDLGESPARPLYTLRDESSLTSPQLIPLSRYGIPESPMTPFPTTLDFGNCNPTGAPTMVQAKAIQETSKLESLWLDRTTPKKGQVPGSATKAKPSSPKAKVDSADTWNAVDWWAPGNKDVRSFGTQADAPAEETAPVKLFTDADMMTETSLVQVASSGRSLIRGRKLFEPTRSVFKRKAKKEVKKTLVPGEWAEKLVAAQMEQQRADAREAVNNWSKRKTDNDDIVLPGLASVDFDDEQVEAQESPGFSDASGKNSKIKISVKRSTGRVRIQSAGFTIELHGA